MITWQELRGVINEKERSDSDFKHECVTVYNAETGEFDLADILDFCESDGIIDAGKTCISIKTESLAKTIEVETESEDG